MKGFTLTELIIVVILVSVLAVFILPNYGRSMEMEYERTARINLQTINEAEHLLKVKAGTYWPTGSGEQDIDAINDALNINISEDGVSYTCDKLVAGVKCLATRDGNAFTLGLCLNTGVICCEAGSCPSITAGCPY